MVLNKLFGKKNKSQEYFFEATETETVSTEENSGDESASVTEAKPTTAVTTSVNVSYDVPDWVKAIKNYSNQNNGNASSGEGDNFAGKYVTNNVPQSRRRPGPSLAKFKGMASQINR